MVTNDELGAAYQQLIAAGALPSSQVATGEWPTKYQVERFLRQRQAPPPPARAPDGLTLATLIAAARECAMLQHRPHWVTVVDALNHRRPRSDRYTEADLWQCLRPSATTPKEQAALAWKLTRLAGQLAWTQVTEVRDLEALWQRCVVAPIGAITPQDRDRYAKEQFAKLAEQQRQAVRDQRARMQGKAEGRNLEMQNCILTWL